MCFEDAISDLYWLYLSCLKDAAHYCDFALPIGGTSYTDKIVMQGLEDAAKTKDVMEEYATNNNLQTRLNLKKIEKYVKAKESAKRSMAELTMALGESHGTTNKLSNYRRGKSSEEQGPPKR